MLTKQEEEEEVEQVAESPAEREIRRMAEWDQMFCEQSWYDELEHQKQLDTIIMID